MKQIMTDIQEIRVELDSEDQELMRMFPRSRMASLQDMLLIQKGDELFLIRKEYMARKRKLVHGIIWASMRFRNSCSARAANGATSSA